MVATPTERADGPTRADSREQWTDFAHTGPGTLAGRFMRMFWHPVHRGQDLAPGRAIPLRIMSEDFTLYRGESGDVHLLAQRCAHRGTQLSTGWVEGDTIRCRYHGWVYDAAGQCLEQPGEKIPFCERIHIRSYPVREHLGLVFAYLGEGDPPPFSEFPEFNESEGILDTVKPARSPCNYFQRVENGPDELHLYFAHRTGHTGAPYVDAEYPTLEAHETEYGFVQYGHRSTGIRSYHYITPNLGYLANHPRYPEEEGIRRRLIWRVPIDDQSYWSFATLLIPVKGEGAKRYRERMETELTPVRNANNKERFLWPVLAGEMTVEDIQQGSATADMENRTNLEDDIVQVGQGVIADRTQDHLASQDIGIITLRNIWMRELRALAEGRPTKQWIIPPLPGVSGGVRSNQ
jgi:5,5'-dehydrodivanillate O-demethylase oxygenase subunit